MTPTPRIDGTWRPMRPLAAVLQELAAILARIEGRPRTKACRRSNGWPTESMNWPTPSG